MIDYLLSQFSTSSNVAYGLHIRVPSITSSESILAKEIGKNGIKDRLTLVDELGSPKRTLLELILRQVERWQVGGGGEFGQFLQKVN